MPLRIAVAASGGRDSTALLHATARAARGLGVEVHALHVHHGLMLQADAWWTHVESQCRRWRAGGLPVRFHGQRLDGQPMPGDSVEAWARRERYAKLAGLARSLGIDCVLLAHHRRDQAETFLLQALRGAGPLGLAAMPTHAVRDGIRWSRPWLDMPREAIDGYVARYRLGHVDDASNRDPRYLRSRMRQALWPVLAAAFPQAEATLSAAARRAQEAAACLTELADLDMHTCVDSKDRLDVVAWRQLSGPRGANLLRNWLPRFTGDGVPDSLVARLADELPVARTSCVWPLHDLNLRLDRGLLSVVPADEKRVVGPASMPIDLSRPGLLPTPAWGGTFLVRDAGVGQGISCARLAAAELRARRGAEQFQGNPRSVPRSLKKHYQAVGVPAAERMAPLVYVGGALAFVPGLGIDARQMALPGEPGCELEWVRGPAPRD